MYTRDRALREWQAELTYFQRLKAEGVTTVPSGIDGPPVPIDEVIEGWAMRVAQLEADPTMTDEEAELYNY